MRALLHLAPRIHGESAFAERLAALAGEMAERAARRGARLTALERLADDPMGPHTPYRSVIELTGEALAPSLVEELTAGLGDALDDVAHVDLCTLLWGEDRVFVASAGAPVRYQYLMRRNARFTHDAYLKRYAEGHSRFGVEAPGKRGYVQFHGDPQTSRALAHAAGVGLWNVDSIAELHLDSKETWFRAMRDAGFGPEPLADEEHFVDRSRSWDMLLRVA
ncbi:MAG: EthD domain-containing protein [Myxococcota bacterium]